MTGSRLGWFGAGAAIFLIAAPALGQTSLDDPLDARDARRVARMEKVVRELRAIVFKAQKTGAPVVVQPADTDARMADQAAKIDDLQLSLTRINGSLETATHDVDQARRVIVALQAQAKALTDRINALEQKLAEAQTPPPPPPPESAIDAPKAGAADAFAKARQLMLSGDYDAAETAFGAFGADYPDDPKAPEANYWWGKTLAVRGDTTKAAGALIASIRGWPQTQWAPDAVVELSRALIALKKPADACQTLAELGRRYPKAPPAVTGKAAAARRQAECAAP
jgi:tol-pal system protein YbgF